MASQAREADGRGQFQGSTGEGGREASGRRRARRAHEALPHTPPGEKSPPETPGPLSLGRSMFQNGKNPSRVRRPRTNRAPLTDSFRSEDSPEMRERGPSGNAAFQRLPSVGPEKIPGGATQKRLTQDGPLMEAATEGSGLLWRRPRFKSTASFGRGSELRIVCAQIQ
jgi:hypothetical protein